MPPERPSDSSDDRNPTDRRASRRRPTCRAEAERVLIAAAAARPQDLPPAMVALHRGILRDDEYRRTRQRWDTQAAALVAAASVDAAIEPIVTALRLASLEHGPGDHPRLKHATGARKSVAAAAGWAWCALLCQLPDDADACRWAAGACRATQRAFERDDDARIGIRIDGAVGQACRSLIAAAVPRADADDDGLPPARLAVAIGGLGAAYELLAVLEPR